MMKVLHYIPSIDKVSGGVGAFMQLLSRDLGRVCELHIVTHHSDDELLLENCIIHYIPYKYLPWSNCKEDFLMILNKVRPDLVHINCCWIPLPSLVAQWSKKAGYKVVYTPHGMLEPYSINRHYWTKKLPAILLYQRKGISISDWIHATANTERLNIEKLGWNQNLFVIPNCVQIDQIEMKGSWRRYKTILFLSRVHPKKGVNFLIEAVSLLREELSGYKVIIAGPGDEAYINSLRQLAFENGVGDLFNFIGPVFGDRKWELYRSSDLLVLPTYSENFGIVVPEALAAGTPVVTTIGTPWEELHSFHCGWYINIGTSSLAEALRQFLSCSETELKQLGENGRSLVEEKYTSKAIAKQMLLKYKDILHQD